MGRLHNLIFLSGLIINVATLAENLPVNDPENSGSSITAPDPQIGSKQIYEKLDQLKTEFKQLRQQVETEGKDNHGIRLWWRSVWAVLLANIAAAAIIMLIPAGDRLLKHFHRQIEGSPGTAPRRLPRGNGWTS